MSICPSRITDFNEAVAILCTFMLLVKCTLFMLHLWFPLFGTLVNTVITVLWIVSAHGQAGPDHSDPAHPSSIAWYITHSCNIAKTDLHDWSGYCKQAKASFGVTIFMMYVPFPILSAKLEKLTSFQTTEPSSP